MYGRDGARGARRTRLRTPRDAGHRRALRSRRRYPASASASLLTLPANWLVPESPRERRRQALPARQPPGGVHRVRAAGGRAAAAARLALDLGRGGSSTRSSASSTRSSSSNSCSIPWKRSPSLHLDVSGSIRPKKRWWAHFCGRVDADRHPGILEVAGVPVRIGRRSCSGDPRLACDGAGSRPRSQGE